MKLYEIADQYRTIEAVIEQLGGEVTPEVEARLNALDGAIEDKVDGIGALVAEWEHEAEAYKAEAKRLSAAGQVASNKAERLREYLRANLANAGLGKIKGKFFSARPAVASNPTIRWTASGEPPKAFLRVKVELDGLKARDYLKEHGGLPEGFSVSYSPWLDLR